MVLPLVTTGISLAVAMSMMTGGATSGGSLLGWGKQESTCNYQSGTYVGNITLGVMRDGRKTTKRLGPGKFHKWTSCSGSIGGGDSAVWCSWSVDLLNHVNDHWCQNTKPDSGQIVWANT
jgi:hypothetical protein